MLTQEDEPSFRPSTGDRSPGKRAAMALSGHSPPPATQVNGQTLPGGRQNAIPRNSGVAAPTRPVATPPRRRSGAPTSIPNFPGANDHRTPAPVSGLPPSPIRSPGPSSPPIQSSPNPSTSSPTPFKMPSTMSLPSLRTSTPSGSATSPWAFLGATSGAPTPSLDGPGRSSPHLGGPFEQLNLNGSWSGGNLWAEGSTEAAPPLATPTRSTSVGSGAGMNAEMLAKYRSMAGRASASGSRGENGVTPMEGVESQPSVKPALPAALARRRGSLPKPNLALPPTSTHGVKSPSPLGGPSTSTDSSGLHALSASDTPKLISQPSTLVLDVRPPSAYLAAHLPTSHSIPIPSTLIRRPAFTVAKVLLMLSPESRDAVRSWKSKSNIVLLDVDSTSAGSGSLLEGLASKFTREGFGGKMWFVKGGQTALESNPSVEMVCTEEAETIDGVTSPGPSTLSPSGNFTAGGLGSFAFLHGSTGSGTPAARNLTGGFPFTPSAAKSNPFESSSGGGTPGASARPLSLKGMMLGGATTGNSSVSGTSGSTGSYKPKLQPANPFFDNIRQNLELSHGGITERIPLQLPEEARRRAHELPPWLCELVTLSEADGADQLAQQFYTVERNEQKRLQALMDWHTEGSGAVLPGTTADDLGKKGKASSWARQQKKDRADVERLEEWGKGHRPTGQFGQAEEEYYPFSITAGVERGIKNRYKNIWPYDFSRVRLVSPCEDESDYINASYIQPRGTSKRYIATQGPLDATFRDFWTLIWEQDVRVIVMLTKQFEGGQVKCGNYWQDQHYGPLHLRLDRQVGGEDLGRPPQSAGFDFGAPSTSTKPSSPSPSDPVPKNIKRTFYLSNDHHPSDPPRKIVQLQCISWPDFDVPTSPDVLLGLIADVADARDETDTAPDQGQGDDAPVLIHCSAGIGRTGSFILVDSILDALARGRNEQRKRDEEVKTSAIPTPISIAGRSTANSRHASGSPKAGAQSVLSESGESGMSRHHGKVKSVSFASGDKIVLPGAGPDEAPPAKRMSKSGSPAPPFGLGISTPIHFPAPAAKSASAPIKLSSQPQSQGLDWLPRDQGAVPESGESGGEAMEVDSPFEYPSSTNAPSSNPTAVNPSSANLSGGASAGGGAGDKSEENNQSVNQWLQYREEEASEAGTAATSGRRPSLASVYTSDEKLSSEKLSPVTEDREEPHPIATTRNDERQPTPLAEMDNPVLDVLESMRVQRMSLVQSLRQFVFAYKVIIHQSFAMLDEENARDRRHHGALGEDDDSTQKRRASPTELAHDRPSMEIEERTPAVAGALGRKASVKRMKQEPAGGSSGK